MPTRWILYSPASASSRICASCATQVNRIRQTLILLAKVTTPCGTHTFCTYPWQHRVAVSITPTTAQRIPCVASKNSPTDDTKKTRSINKGRHQRSHLCVFGCGWLPGQTFKGQTCKGGSGCHVRLRTGSCSTALLNQVDASRSSGINDSSRTLGCTASKMISSANAMDLWHTITTRKHYNTTHRPEVRKCSRPVVGR